MKFSCTSDELEQMEGLGDTELAALIRKSLSEFRGKRSDADAEADAEDDDLSDATTTGATGGPREGARVAQDALARATHDAALKAHERGVRQAARDREAEAIVPGINRL